MNFVRKVVLPLAGVIAVALIVMIASPRAAHALAAALVQVANTPNTAVPTVQAPAASQIASGSCWAYITSAGHSEEGCQGFAVPAEKTLVIEAFSAEADLETGYIPIVVTLSGDVTASHPPGLHAPMIKQGNEYGGSDHYVGTVGARLYVPAGEVPRCTMVSSQSMSGQGGLLRCYWSGYYVPAH